MTEKQEKFLYMAVVEGIKYEVIETELNIKRSDCSLWWEELKEERLELANIRDLWKKKCKDIPFEEFRKWYDDKGTECYYCGVTEENLDALWKKGELTKRKRGKKLEMERIKPDLPYSNDLNNVVMACYWCNNAKTDTFTAEEFEPIGKLIGEIWKKRLHDHG